MPGTVNYLYCIVHASRAPSASRAPRGLPGATRPTTTPLARWFWLVSASVPRDLYGPEALDASLRDVQWITDIALAHEGVVEHFARQTGATVIPMKLFTMFSSEKRAIEKTRSRLPELEQVIGRIAGCEEWGVRITLRRITPGEAAPAPSRLLSGTEFLAVKRAARDQAQTRAATARDAAEAAYTMLCAIARDARRRRDVPEGATSPPLLDAAFLVPADDRRRFKAAVKKLADANHGTVVTLTGPWPSYNFIDPASHA